MTIWDVRVRLRGAGVVAYINEFDFGVGLERSKSLEFELLIVLLRHLILDQVNRVITTLDLSQIR